MIEITFIGSASFLVEDAEQCDNAGPCCLSCPLYDECDHHYEENEA